MILMNIFDACDLDDNGTLNREEFNIYNVRTGDEQVTDEEWKVVQRTYRLVFHAAFSIALFRETKLHQC